MDYIKISVVVTPNIETASDLLIAQMGEFGYDGFEMTDNGFDAYIVASRFDAAPLANLDPVVPGVRYKWEQSTVKDQDWNQTWERNYFKPIAIDDRCLVRSSFHQVDKTYEYEIIIEPRMAFGTGHHATTCMMMRLILANDMNHQRVLDMGCGTGILGILTSLRGAREVHGIDIDTWSVDNARDNISINGIVNFSVEEGNADMLRPNDNYDVILANINRNVLLADIPAYARAAHKDCLLLLSGFYADDAPMVREEAEKHGFAYRSMLTDDNWAALQFIKRTQ